MPETTEKEAASLSERIRACLASKSIGPGEVRMNPTISVGVVDAGLGSAFGINLESTDDEVDRQAELFRSTVESIL